MVGDNKEREGKGKTWHSLNKEDYAEARNSTDLLEFKYTMPDPLYADCDNFSTNWLLSKIN